MGRPKNSLAELNKKSIFLPLTGCRLWKGKLQSNGYGATCFEDKDITVHRLAYAFYKNIHPSEIKLNVNHKQECPYKNCFAEEHLYEGTQKQNIQDAREMGHRTWARMTKTKLLKGV